MTEILAGAGVEMLATILLATAFIPVLKSVKMGQKILDIGPRWHKSKEGTPTMGGLFFLVPMVIIGAALAFLKKEPILLAHLVFLLANGAIGFADDYVKFFKKQNEGLTPPQKMVLQFAAATAYVFALKSFGCIDTVIRLPFTQAVWELSLPVYLVLAVIGIVFTVNSVNLTDGIDGLASSVTAVVMVFMAVLSFKTHNVPGLVISLLSVGGTLGFLWYNFHPAKVFMGDTGSLFLGAAVSSMAFILDCPLLLVFTGFVYYIESFSVILQVLSFKLTGKRIFKMSPIHHHFELCGWSEIKIVTVFSFIAALLCLVGSFGFLPTL